MGLWQGQYLSTKKIQAFFPDEKHRYSQMYLCRNRSCKNSFLSVESSFKQKGKRQKLFLVLLFSPKRNIFNVKTSLRTFYENVEFFVNKNLKQYRKKCKNTENKNYRKPTPTNYYIKSDLERILLCGCPHFLEKIAEWFFREMQERELKLYSFLN